MKPIIIVIMAAAIIMPVLHHNSNKEINNARKIQKPSKKTEKKQEAEFLFHSVNVKLNAF